MSELRFVVDDETYEPYFQGKWKQADGGRPQLKPLNIEWLEHHFGNFPILAQRLGVKKVDDPSVKNGWKLPPKSQRWLPVPMGFNANKDSINPAILCQGTPIAHPQGTTHTCLFNSVASAFSHMKYDIVADHIVKNKLASVGIDGKSQWDLLIKVLQEEGKTQEKIYVKKYNFQSATRGYLPKHKLNIETLTTDHEDSMHVHAALLVGKDGRQAHAVAVVDGMVFDSSASHAMRLTRDALDWCCDSSRGYKRTGCALRIKVAQRKSKAQRNLQLQQSLDKKPTTVSQRNHS